ncbi:hypothetical protein T265_01259 [Opisthorchis viverrini]|uniref:RNA helicase n=1 Tax=Opisthorchis viverrini TaxID=6198 RepID=A0A075AAH7_OPIVI|nr:hypothetical protein T265_01259 [Opisthorchis viverrini]KER32780.1 hypothetical protein T265_01259 [Opisthorchis viverrini]
MLLALRGSTKVQKYGATVIRSSCICCARYLHAYVEDVDQPRKSRAYLREPPGFVAAHRWMLHRAANDNLQNLLFHGEQKDRAPGVEGNFLSSAVRANLSGSPVKDNLTYPIIDTPITCHPSMKFLSSQLIRVDNAISGWEPWDEEKSAASDVDRYGCQADSGGLHRSCRFNCVVPTSYHTRTDNSVRLVSVLRAASARHMAPTSSGISKSVFKPRHPVYLAAFSDLTLQQAGQEAALALTLDSLGIVVLCLRNKNLRYKHTFGYAPLVIQGCCGGMCRGWYRPESSDEVSLLDWIPVDSRLCAVRLATSVKESHRRQVDRCMFTVSAYAPTDCSSDIVVVAGDMNEQVGMISVSETQLGGRHALNSIRKLDELTRIISSKYVNSYYEEIATSLHSAENFACGTALSGALKQTKRWHCLNPGGPEHNLKRPITRRQVKRSVQADREVWSAGNARRLFSLIRATGPRKPPVSEAINGRNVADIPLVDRRLYENLSRMGFDQLTPVQRHAIGLLCTEDVTEVPGGEASYQRVTGRYDLMAAAQTGSGKTLAYLIPMVNRLLRVYPYEAMQSLLGQPSCQFPSGLILAPTRELVQQILSEVTKLSYRTFLRPVGIYGGERPVRQLHQISLGCHVAVATPGRLLDFLRQGKLLLSHCRSLVLDEADRMLDMGFEEQIREILESPEHCMPKPQESERQTCLFSATFPREVSLLARNFLRGSRCISLTLGGQDAGVVVPEWGKSTGRGTDLSSLTRIVPREIRQRIEFVPSSSVQTLHSHLLDLVRRLISGGEQSAEEGALNQVLIFCNTKREVDEVDARLYQNGVKSASIHGDKSQPHRSRALELFRRGTVQVLVASSVAARGLDIPHVTAVINVGFPVEIDDYVHRIGRTGRMGRAGEAITVLNQTLLDKASRSVARGVLRVLQSSMGDTEANIPEPVLSFACLNPNDFDEEEPRFTARRSSQSKWTSPHRSNRYSGFGDKKRSFGSLDELSRRYT